MKTHVDNQQQEQQQHQQQQHKQQPLCRIRDDCY